MDIDWDSIVAASREAMEAAYCPYSNFKVGAAALVDDGRMVTGCNAENVSYGLTLCAECGMVLDLVRNGGGKLLAISIVKADGEPTPPCGRCRQIMAEHSTKDTEVMTPFGPKKLIGDLLPYDRSYGGEAPEHTWG